MKKSVGEKKSFQSFLHRRSSACSQTLPEHLSLFDSAAVFAVHSCIFSPLGVFRSHEKNFGNETSSYVTGLVFLEGNGRAERHRRFREPFWKSGSSGIASNARVNKPLTIKPSKEFKRSNPAQLSCLSSAVCPQKPPQSWTETDQWARSKNPQPRRTAAASVDFRCDISSP